jgi:hypothetical protein
VNAAFRLRTATVVTIGFPSTTASTGELGACCLTIRSRLPILGLGLESRGKEYARSLGSLGWNQDASDRNNVCSMNGYPHGTGEKAIVS